MQLCIYRGFFLIYCVLFCIHNGNYFTMLSVGIYPLEFYGHIALTLPGNKTRYL